MKFRCRYDVIIKSNNVIVYRTCGDTLLRVLNFYGSPRTRMAI